MATVTEMRDTVRLLKENEKYRQILVKSSDYPLLQSLYFEFFGGGSVPLTKVERTNKGEKLSPVSMSVNGEVISTLAMKQWNEFWQKVKNEEVLMLKPRE